MMNSSDNLAQQVPERIDIEPIGSRSLVHETKSPEDATGTSEEEHTSIVEDEPNIGGPGKELTAASALTSLVKPPASEEAEEDFDIPQRFTKSGRKKATPFPMKVSAHALTTAFV